MRLSIITILIFGAFATFGQDTIKQDEIAVKDTVINSSDNDLNMFKTEIQGQIVTAMVTETGDTLYMADLGDVSITSLRTFKDDADYRKYVRFKHYASVVYPYAKKAIRIFRETEYATQNLSKRKRKKVIKKLEEELRTEFEGPLTKMTKLQGKIMIKMIERELDNNMYNLIAGLRGNFTAFYWHNFAKLYSYDLKEGYNYGDYEILDAVLQDFDISYRIEQDNLNN